MKSLEELINDGGVYEILKSVARDVYQIASPDGRIHPRESFINDIELAQARLQELQGLSDKEKKARTDAYNTDVQKVLNEEVKLTDEEIRKRNEAVMKILHKFDSIDTENLCATNGIDDERIECELDYLISEVAHAVSNLYINDLPEVLKVKTVDEWYGDAITSATGLVQQSITAYQYELSRCQLINDTLEILDMFEEANANL